MTESNLHPTAPPAQAAELISVDTLSGRDVERWERLAERSLEPNPFFRPDFVLAAAHGRAERTLLLVVRRDGEWVACLPVVPAWSWEKLVLRCLAPWLPQYAYLGTPLVDPAHLAPAAAAIADWTTPGNAGGALILGPADAGGRVLAELWGAFASRGREPIVHAQFERAALVRRSEPTYVDHLRAKRLRELARQRRRLEEELAAPTELVDCSDDPAAYERFLSLEKEGWKGEAGTALASSPGDARFFRELCARTADRGRLQLLALALGERIVAMQCNLLDRDCMFAFKVAYDRTLARFSPGVLLEMDAIGAFHETLDAEMADSCAAPDSELINRLWPDRRRVSSVVLPSTAGARAILATGLGAKRGARRVVQRIVGSQPAEQ